jgi:hypothetical protein
VVSNPYAPPEGGPRTDAPPQAPGDGRPPTVGPSGNPPTSPARTPDHSPEGVPYERPRGTAPTGSAPTGPAPRATDVHRVAVLTRATSLIVLAAVLADLLSFPWHMAAVPLAIAAVAVGGHALAVASRTRVRNAPRAVLGMLMVVAMFALMRPAQTALTWDAESAFAQCRSGALTTQAQNACLSQYEQALTDRLKEFQQRQQP